MNTISKKIVSYLKAFSKNYFDFFLQPILQDMFFQVQKTKNAGKTSLPPAFPAFFMHVISSKVCTLLVKKHAIAPFFYPHLIHSTQKFLIFRKFQQGLFYCFFRDQKQQCETGKSESPTVSHCYALHIQKTLQLISISQKQLIF